MFMFIFFISGGLYCNATWDTMQCWDYTPAGTTVFQYCPDYVTLSNPLGEMSMSCVIMRPILVMLNQIFLLSSQQFFFFVLTFLVLILAYVHVLIFSFVLK